MTIEVRVTSIAKSLNLTGLGKAVLRENLRAAEREASERMREQCAKVFCVFCSGDRSDLLYKATPHPHPLIKGEWIHDVKDDSRSVDRNAGVVCHASRIRNLSIEENDA